MKELPPPLVRFARGYVGGSLIGFGLLAYGLTVWGFALALGVDKDKSTDGLSLMTFYVISFGFAGGVIWMFDAAERFSMKTCLAWGFALIIVMSGCAFIASYISTKAPVDWDIAFAGGFAVTVLFVMSLKVGGFLKRIRLR